MGHDDDPQSDDLPIRFRPLVRLFRQDALAPSEPLIRQVQDEEFAVRPDLSPVPPVAEAQEHITAMFDDGQSEFDLIMKLKKSVRRRIQMLTLRCSGNPGCALVEVYQRGPQAPWVIHAHGDVQHNGSWEPMPLMAISAQHRGIAVELRLRCRCTGGVVNTSPDELIDEASAAPGVLRRV